MSKKDLAKPEAGGLVVPEEFDDVLSQGQEYERGDLQVPFLKITQSLSPQRKKSNAKYDPRAEDGMIYETVLGNLYDGEEEGILVVPVYYTRQYAEWLPERGGLVQDFGSDPSILEECEKGPKGGYIHKQSGNEISESAFFFVMYKMPDLGIWDQAVIPMASTGWAAARNWNTQIRKLVVMHSNGSRIPNPAMFAGAYRLKTILQKKDEYEYYTWLVRFEEYTLNLPDGSNLIRQAAEYRKMIAEGRVKTGPLDEEDRDEKEPF